ncbi:MAG: protoheme IX farnesyltransferase [Phycisphaerae bacterium]|jgi:protoheme IX farnesyltransferase|nr:MAG: protoheme IX farnesyltransferase [Phycisphaerae bacterium]
MKLTADLEPLEGELALTDSGRSLVGDFLELTKARLNLMVLITTLIGFVVGLQMTKSEGGIDWWLLCQTLLGTGLCAAGAGALNQAWEYRFDAMMSRTADRPVASGRLKPVEATLFGLLMSMTGTIMLVGCVNSLSALLAILTIVLYVVVYTPLKRLTTLNTLIGAVPGAIPPVIGYSATAQTIDLEAMGLFAILFCWQIPHFLAIAILCRDDYRAAGYRMMPVVHPTLKRTHLWMIVFNLLLIGASFLPLMSAPTGTGYIISATVLGTGFLCINLLTVISPSRQTARTAFFASIAYLPLILGSLMIDRFL